LGRHGSDHNEVFVELLTLHQRSLYGFIYTFVPNPADAEDLLQQTNLVLWEKSGDFDPHKSFSAWACGIAHFLVLHHLREKRRSRVVFSEELVARLAKVRHDQEDASLADSTILAGCVKELSESDQKLVELCYSAKHNIKAAAAALGRPASSVYVSLVRVRRLLMDCIKRISTEEGRR
jgi:RNA polymerase sigma-70 factor, ECF subfamily